MKQLKDRIAVVTGAGSGIGRALSLLLAQEGCHLAVADINREGLAETERQVADYRALCDAEAAAAGMTAGSSA